MIAERFTGHNAQPGDIVVDTEGARWLVHGTSRYAGGSGGRRTPGLSVRPEAGGRARVIACARFVAVERR